MSKLSKALKDAGEKLEEMEKKKADKKAHPTKLSIKIERVPVEKKEKKEKKAEKDEKSSKVTSIRKSGKEDKPAAKKAKKEA